ncbi:MAG: formylglycine-generating enzyme family protein [Reyranellaceae bacterium]
MMRLVSILLLGCVASAQAQGFRDCDQCPEMVPIPLGSFVMGAEPGEEEREKVPRDHRGLAAPRRSVSITERFSLGRYEVTRGQYAAFVSATGRAAGPSCWSLGPDGKWRDRQGMSWLAPGFAQTEADPVVCVSWHDAQAYVQWLSTTTGKKYRLPSEAEWEYAARAGSSTSRYWGDDRDQACRFANLSDRTAAQLLNWSADPEETFQCSDEHVYTAPVGKFQANAFGLHDMLGNVWEWVEDCGNDDYEGAPATQGARLTGNCNLRVARGGGWYADPHEVRAAARDTEAADSRHDGYGFRVVRAD